ncbi:MAG TPA: glycosyl hydrolase [Cytophagales bacterium]|nr:glycosyl hydrolase [Cytophagales bacterium]HAP59709.1 glycosyl hydrolase [Cytophagales bacterium]
MNVSHLPKNLLLLILLPGLLWACNEGKTSIVEDASAPSPVTTDFDPSGKSVQIITTAQDTDLRLAATETLALSRVEQPLETEVGIFVNPRHAFQTFLGIGGAITDASAEVFAQLPADKQEELLKAYYDAEEGIGYTLARTHIHSCDFSSGSYTYVSDEDPELGTFSIAHDQEFRIPMIKRATEAAGGELLLYASPWSPPAFMKTNNHMLQGGKLKPEFYESWANYYVKFIQAYEAEGMPIWGLTIQNEPMATQVWESCIYTAEEERDFLKNHLGPTMAAVGLGDKNIIVWDHNRDLMGHRAHTIFDDPEANKYAWGIGNHWYETWTGSTEMNTTLGEIKAAYPDKQILFTEGCQEAFDPARYQYWPNAERYGRNMINDFNNGSVGWTDWNILLDERGGPNHVENFCFAPIHGDTQAGELIYTPTYYYMGHFSKYIRPGAKRVTGMASRSHLLTTSWLNTDGTLATVVMNPQDEAITYRYYLDDQGTEITIPARAMQTLLVN